MTALFLDSRHPIHLYLPERVFSQPFMRKIILLLKYHPHEMTRTEVGYELILNMHLLISLYAWSLMPYALGKQIVIFIAKNMRLTGYLPYP